MWHMRAAAWSISRDVDAARLSWERAAHIADDLPHGAPNTLAQRIAPRTMLCATDWQAGGVDKTRGRFAKLRELCDAAGDKVSLAIGMTGLATELLYAGRPGEGSQLASEQMTLLDSIGDPDLTVGLAFMAFANWFNAGEFGEILRWSQAVIDLADGDATKGAGFGLGSPLAVAMAFHGVAGWWAGRQGWSRDLEEAVEIARRSDPITFALVVAWTYGLGIGSGVLPADDSALETIEEAVQITQRASNDFAVCGAQFTLAVVLLERAREADRRRGLELLVYARDNYLPVRTPSLVPTAELWIAREKARRDDRDASLTMMRKALRELTEAGRLGWGILGTGVLAETLLAHDAKRALAEVTELIDQLVSLPDHHGSAIRHVMVLRLRALHARARGDDASYRELATQYHAAASSFGYKGHIAWAEQMIRDRESGTAASQPEHLP
jgi:hypothetical protein